MHLSEKERIEVLMMIGFRDKVHTQQEVCNLFNASDPDRPRITRSTVSNLLHTNTLQIYLKEDQQKYLRILNWTFC